MSDKVTIEIPKDMANFLQDKSEKSLNEYVLEILREKAVTGDTERGRPRNNDRHDGSDPYSDSGDDPYSF